MNQSQGHFYLFKEHIPLGHLPDGSECVLYNTHDRLVGLGCDDHAGCDVEVLNLGTGLHALWYVQVHLVSIKVSVVR